MNKDWNGIATVDDKEYKIEWWHSQTLFCNPRDLEVLQSESIAHRAITKCWIIDKNEHDEACRLQNFELLPVGYGCAICSWKDNFCRRTGRKISLGRALLDTDFTKEQRRQVWEQILTVEEVVNGYQGKK